MKTKWSIDSWPRTFLGRIVMVAAVLVVLAIITRESPLDARNVIADGIAGVVMLGLIELGARVACWAELRRDTLVVRTGALRSHRNTALSYSVIEQVNVLGRQVTISYSDASPRTLKFTMNGADDFVRSLDARRVSA